MTLSEYVAALRRGWIILLVATVFTLACAGVLVLRKSEVYSTSTELFVAPTVAKGDPDLLAERNSIATSRVTSYVNVVSGDVVEKRVDEQVEGGLGDASVSVSVPLNTVVLVVTVTSSDAQHAADVAGAYAEVVPQVIEELETSSDSPPQVQVQVIDEADVPSAPTASSSLPTLVAAGVLGLGIGFTIVMIREVLRRERSEADMAAASGAESS